MSLILPEQAALAQIIEALHRAEHIEKKFQISTPQASLDIRHYTMNNFSYESLKVSSNQLD